MRRRTAFLAIFMVLLASIGEPRASAQRMAGSDPPDQEYVNLLWRVVAYGSPELIRGLFESGSDMYRVLPNGRTMLSIAASENPDAEVTRIFLEKGFAPNQADEEGFTPLIVAAGAGHLETVRLLIQFGADVNACTRRGYSALHSAAGSKDPRLVLDLLEAGADPSLVFDGLSPLDIAQKNPALAGTEALKKLEVRER
jgi:uncharacterized protein